jgi:hypothetical protein
MIFFLSAYNATCRYKAQQEKNHRFQRNHPEKKVGYLLDVKLANTNSNEKETTETMYDKDANIHHIIA